MFFGLLTGQNEGTTEEMVFTVSSLTMICSFLYVAPQKGLTLKVWSPVGSICASDWFKKL